MLFVYRNKRYILCKSLTRQNGPGKHWRSCSDRRSSPDKSCIIMKITSEYSGNVYLLSFLRFLVIILERMQNYNCLIFPMSSLFVSYAICSKLSLCLKYNLSEMSGLNALLSKIISCKHLESLSNCSSE